jgi:hypothetical protein
MSRHSHEVFDSKRRLGPTARRLVEWVSGGTAEDVKSSVEALQASTETATPSATPATTPAPLHEGLPVETDAIPHVDGSAAGSAARPETLHATSHVGFHVGPRASGSARSAPLPTVRIGDKSRVVNGKAEWSQEDFAMSFLRWFEATQPDDWGTWVWVPDIRKHYWPRFRTATGARYLQFGVLIHGLRAVTRDRTVQYRDETGRRRSSVEYFLGPNS